MLQVGRAGLRLSDVQANAGSAGVPGPVIPAERNRVRRTSQPQPAT
jgi:hypothetical protein